MNKLTASLTLVLASAAFLQVGRAADGTDLILGFQAANSTTDYLVDLGAETTFTTTTATETFSNVSSSELTSLYGADLTSGDSNAVKFFVSGTNAAQSLYYITDHSGTPAAQNGSTVDGTAADVYSIYQSYDVGTSVGTSQVTEATSNPSSETSVAGSNDSFGDFSYTTYGTTPASGLTTLKLFELTDTSSSVVNVGTFTFNSANDSLSFTGSAAAVPEPSTYVLMAIGAIGLYFGTRRKSLASI